MTSARVITVASYGPALDKSTYCFELGKSLAAAGRNVLLMDASPSAELTQLLCLTPGRQPSLGEMLLSQRSGNSQKYILAGGKFPKSLALIPGDASISKIEIGVRQHLRDLDMGIVMVAPVEALRSQYDYILIDAPANSVEPAVLMALAASDWVVLVSSSPDLLEDVGVAQSEVNAKLRVILAPTPTPAKLAEELLSGKH